MSENTYKPFNPTHCINCGVKLKDCFDRDPNGDPNCVCAKCKAEESHDFDVEPDVVFDRGGHRVPEPPKKMRIVIEMPASGVKTLMEKWKTNRPEVLEALKATGLDIVGIEEHKT